MGKRRSTRQDLIKTREMEDFVKLVPTNSRNIFFEFENYVTEDVAEAVAIMMRSNDVTKSFWEQKIVPDNDSIDPRKSLYWLTGGDREWIKLSNYTRPWSEVEDVYENEFKFLIKWIVNKSKTMGEIRDSFIKYLNLPVLYEFALEKGIIK